jgi:hypothetical protein
MAYLLLDKMLSDYNKNKPSGKPALERTDFGRLLWTNRMDGNIKSTLSLWSTRSSAAIPSFSMAIKICDIIGIDLNTYKNEYLKQI